MSSRSPAPTIPLLINNTIDLDELGSDGLRTFALYDNPEDGDALYPSWWGRSPSGEPIDYANGDVIPVIYESEYADPDLGMPMEIENALVQRLDQGEVLYSYLLERRSREKVESDRISFYVGRRDFLPAPQVKESHDEFLDPDFPVTTFSLVAPPYRAMAIGDVVTLRWEGVRQDGVALPAVTRPLPITEARLGQALSWQIPRTEAVKVRDGKVRLSYTITYAAPTLKPTATSAQRQLVISPPTTMKLEKVRIKDFSGSDLDPSAFPQGIRLLITPWPGIRNGDVLMLYWSGSREDRSVIKYQPVDLSSLDTGKIEIPLEYEWLDVNNGQAVSVSYQYLRADASGASEVLDLALRVPLNLPKPTVEDSDLDDDPTPVDGKLDTQYFASTGVTVNIPVTANIADGDTVKMYWKGFGALVEADPVENNPRKFKVPAHAIPANIDRIVEIYYSVKQQGAPVDLPASTSVIYQLRVIKIPQNRLGTLVCEKATAGNPGSLKRSDVPAQGVQVSFMPATWIYIADTQYIEMWLTGVNGERGTIIERRQVTPAEVSAGVRGNLLPVHLASLEVNKVFSIRFIVSFDENETDTPFQSLSLTLL